MYNIASDIRAELQQTKVRSRSIATESLQSTQNFTGGIKHIWSLRKLND